MQSLLTGTIPHRDGGSLLLMKYPTSFYIATKSETGYPMMAFTEAAFRAGLK